MSASSYQGRKILVLGKDCRSFLSVVRSFGRAGFEVHTAWCPPGHPALASRYIRKHHDLTIPASAKPGAADADALPRSLLEFRDLIAREAYDLIVPCNDESIVPLQTHRAAMGKASIYLLNEEAHSVSTSKARTHELAKSLGIPVPYSELVSRIEELARPLAEYPLPVVIKPIASFEPGQLNSRRSVSKIYQRDLLGPAIERALVHGPVLIQENMLGIGVGVEILADRGTVRVVFQHERVHEPLHGGGSSYRRSVPVRPELLEATRQLVAATRYHGVGMFEFKLDPRTGRWILIEINGRFWGSLPLAIAAGADFPLYLYQMLAEERQSFPTGFRTGLYCRNPVDDIEWFRNNLPADKRDPTLATRPLWQVAGEVLNVLTFRERWDTVTLDDPAPGISEFGRWIGEKLSGATHRLGVIFEKSPPGRWLLRRRLAQALAGAKVVAFVCYGNICRSPFGARMARRAFGSQWQVLEGGTGVKADDAPRASPALAREVARDHGVDLEDHRARQTTRELVDRSDVILVFDDFNRDEMLKRFPDAAGKVHLLGALRTDGPLIITDPDGGNRAAFERAYQAIASAVLLAGPNPVSPGAEAAPVTNVARRG